MKRGTVNQCYMKEHIREIRVSTFVAFMVMLHYYCRVAQDCELLHFDRKINTSLKKGKTDHISPHDDGVTLLECWNVDPHISVGHSKSGFYFCFWGVG